MCPGSGRGRGLTEACRTWKTRRHWDARACFSPPCELQQSLWVTGTGVIHSWSMCL